MGKSRPHGRIRDRAVFEDRRLLGGLRLGHLYLVDNPSPYCSLCPPTRARTTSRVEAITPDGPSLQTLSWACHHRLRLTALLWDNLPMPGRTSKLRPKSHPLPVDGEGAGGGVRSPVQSRSIAGFHRKNGASRFGLLRKFFLVAQVNQVAGGHMSLDNPHPIL